jgi:hypothetical protein
MPLATRAFPRAANARLRVKCASPRRAGGSDKRKWRATFTSIDGDHHGKLLTVHGEIAVHGNMAALSPSPAARTALTNEWCPSAEKYRTGSLRTLRTPPWTISGQR